MRRAVSCRPSNCDISLLRELAKPGARLVGGPASPAVVEPTGQPVPTMVRRFWRCGWACGVALPLLSVESEAAKITPKGLIQLREASR